MARRVGRGLFRRRGATGARTGGEPGEESHEHEIGAETEPFPVVEPPEDPERPPDEEPTEAEADEADEEMPAAAASATPPQRRLPVEERAPEAAQQAEIRAMDEILALESDLERAKQQAASEIEELRERLRTSEERADVAAALDAGVDPQELRKEVVSRLEEESREDLARRRTELERRVRAEIESEAEDRIAKIQADADERIRAEVAIARSAAEEHFRNTLAERERELEGERAAKAKLIEDSERRLGEIESKAGEAASRVAAAEARLVEREADLRRDAEARLDAERERIRADAAGDAERRAEELAEELARQQADSQHRIEELESRVRQAEESAARQADEMRTAAAAWIRGQIAVLGKQGAEATAGEGGDLDAERIRAAASRIDAAAAHAEDVAERATPEPDPIRAAEDDTSAWDIRRRPDEPS